MGNKVENCKELGVGSRGYLFFGDELHLGATLEEQHLNILRTSGRTLSEVQVAGRLLVAGDIIAINGDGSTSLNIKHKDPAQVEEFVKGFPDADGRDIFSRTD